MFFYDRYIRFSETDGAGVVYFSQVLNLCHESYEESLRMAGLDLQYFFCSRKLAIPIVHATADFFRPLHCGDRVRIGVVAQRCKPSEFEITYQLYLNPSSIDRSIAEAKTRHVCIDPQTRQRIDCPPLLDPWFLLVQDAE